MATLKLDRCCCCINLRTGCLIIGYLGVISTIIMMGSLEAMVASLEKPYMKDVIVVDWNTIAYFIFVGDFYVLLLVGIYQRSTTLVNVAWIAMIVHTGQIATSYIVRSYSGNAVFGTIDNLLSTCLSIYLALCVRSYYLVLKGEPDEGGQGGRVYVLPPPPSAPSAPSAPTFSHPGGLPIC